ncbi:MAG TPA: hypothetical protein VH116_10960 [Gemmatimonadales bacterium]|nr:hypothetical protein [Gemmatimonadales bacterium]
MHSIRRVLCSAVLVPAVGFAQGAVPAPRPSSAATAIHIPPYRGLTPGIPYRGFVERARALADRDVLRCNTSRTTAQLMECGVAIRDPRDAARFYLSAHFIEGNADVVAFTDSAGFGDTRGTALVDRTKRDLTNVFGRPRRNGRSGWEWRYGRQAIRLSWRGRGTGRWVSITLTDYDVMDRIARYATPAARAKP